MMFIYIMYLNSNSNWSNHVTLKEAFITEIADNNDYQKELPPPKPKGQIKRGKK